MKASFRTGTPLDIQDVYARFTLDSATEFLFGDCVHSIYEPMLLPGGHEPPLVTSGTESPRLAHPSSSAFVRAFSAAQELISNRIRMGDVWPVREMSRDKAEDYTGKLKAYLQPIVDMGLQRKAVLLEKRKTNGGQNKENDKAIDEGMTLLDHLVLETDDVDVIRDSLMNMLIAGRDTVRPYLLRLGFSSSN